MSDERLMTKPRVAALAHWLEHEFDPDVYDRRTLEGMTVDGWLRLAKSALKYMDRVESDEQRLAKGAQKFQPESQEAK